MTFENVKERSGEAEKREVAAAWPLCRIPHRPLACDLTEARAVRLPQRRCLHHQWVVGVRVGQEAKDREQDIADGQGRRPVVLQNVQADGAMLIDIRVVNSGCELQLWGAERIIRGKLDSNGETALRIRRVCWPHDSCRPRKYIIAHRSSDYIRDRVLLDVGQFF